MPLTPADVANVAFSKPPLGKRGYHEDEVDAYLASQLRELDGRGSAAPADPMRNQQDLVTSGSGARAETRS